MKGIDRSPAAPGTLQKAGPLARLLPEWSVIPLIAGLFVLAFRENVGYLNVDDLNAIISDSPTEIYAQISLQDGRYLLVAALRAFKAFDIDGLLDYAVFAALYAFAFAWFCQAAVAYLTRDAGLRPEIVRAWMVLFGALLLTHGFFSDLIAWKIAYPVMLLMLLPVTACLELLARRPLTPRLVLRDPSLDRPGDPKMGLGAPRLFDAGRVRRKAQLKRRSIRVGNGPERCAVWGLRAPARCITDPKGAFEGTDEASHLKLKLVQ